MFAAAGQIARSVLYEGYLLYPYRGSALKNRSRWQFGVVVPPARAAAGHGEADQLATHLLGVVGDDAVEDAGQSPDDDVLHLELRLLHLQARGVQVREAGGWKATTTAAGPDGPVQTWDEAVEVTVAAALPMAAIDRGPVVHDEVVEGAHQVERLTHDVRLVRQRWPLSVQVEVSGRSIEGPRGARVLTIRVANTSSWDPSDHDPLVDPDRHEPRVRNRDEALRRSLLSAHVVIGLDRGVLLSPTDPPDWAREHVAALPHEGLWPALIGPGGRDDVILAAPIIVGDHAQVAPESPRDLFDGTEIDELLTLRTMTLTDEEKREARRTDPRAAAIIDHVDAMPADALLDLHGASRAVDTAGAAVRQGRADAPWWDPAADRAVSPGTDRHPVRGVMLGRGDTVRLRPRRQADAQDMFLDGLLARVEAVLHDVDGGVTFAVTLADDPGADLLAEVGRYRYFGVDEVVPVGLGAESA